MKGFTTDKQLGKRDGRRYYQQKGVEGIVSASINQGMSSRVKNDAAYANTRLNNAEFGAAGSTAGAITRSLSQKWRYLLVPFAAGKLAKDVRALMMDDTTNPWGQRSLQGTDWQKVLAEKVSQYSKNPVSDYLTFQADALLNTQTGLAVSVEFRPLVNETVQAAGATGVYTIAMAMKFNTSHFDAQTNSYTSANVESFVVGGEEANFGEILSLSQNVAEIKDAAQSSNTMIAVLVVALPFKEVNGAKYTLQELCSFQMIAAEPAA